MEGQIKANSEDDNMCDSCQWCYAECCAIYIEFSEHEDNIISCDQYSGTEHGE